MQSDTYRPPVWLIRAKNDRCVNFLTTRLVRKAVELKLTGIALNRLKNLTAHKGNNKGVKVSGFYCNSTDIFSFFSAIFVSPYKSL